MSNDRQRTGSRTIPEFATREEEAEFCDSHDFTDYWDELKPVSVIVRDAITESIQISSPDRSHESVINDTLTRLLRERSGLAASAETLHGGKRPDILLRLADGPAVMEIEIAPALTVAADALSRLGMAIDGHTVQNAFAVIVPAGLRTIPQQHLYKRLSESVLQWQEWRGDGTSGPKAKPR